MKIDFIDKITIRRFQEILNDFYSLTIKDNKIVFDFSRVSWIGFFPASQFFAWAAYLLRKKNTPIIEIVLPANIKTNEQVAKTLLDYGLIARLKELGASVPYYPSSPPIDGLAYKNLNEFGDNWQIAKERIWSYLRSSAEDLSTKLRIPASYKNVISNIFEIILYEIIENAFVHGKGNSPYFAVSYSISSGPSSKSRGHIPPFDQNTPYIEITIGDLGSGINSNLEKFLPDNYIPQYGDKHTFLKAEKVLSYAFDFYSSSSPEKRKKRIEEIISEDKVGMINIATGLFCVMQVVRENFGQILIRTSKGILSYDFYRDKYIPIVKGKSNLGLRKLSPIKGTHYLIRIPLQLPNKRESPFYQSELSSTKKLNLKVLNPFTNYDGTEGEAPFLDRALEIVNEHMNRYRNNFGLTLLLQPDFPLTSRALLAFVTALKLISTGNRVLVWCNPRALSILSDPFMIESKNYISQDTQPVIIGDISTNTFLMFGNKKKIDQLLIDRDSALNRFRIAIGNYDQIKKKYIEVLKKQLEMNIKSPDVLHKDGVYLIEGKYYTKKYYEIPKAFYNTNQIRKYADWLFDIIGKDIDLLIAGSSSVVGVVKELSEIISDFVRQPDILEFNPPYKPSKIITKTIPYKNKRAAIITDVVCRGSNLNDILLYMPNLKMKNVVAMVDARSSLYRSTYSYKFNGHSIIVRFDSLIEDIIDPLEDPPSIVNRGVEREGEDSIERIYVIDPSTKAPALYVRHKKPLYEFSEIIKSAILESNSMIAGHSEYDNKHYSYFLNLPNLIYTLQNEIKIWIQKNILFIKEAGKKTSERWNGLVYDPNGSYQWVGDYLKSDYQFEAVNTVKKDDLFAPRPPQLDLPTANWLIVIPAIASGETARLCIEYVSRKPATNILLLCFMDRMDPFHESFFSGISKYRDSNLRISFFLDFPIGAFEPKPSSCPLCAELESLKSIYSRICEIYKAENEIVRAIESKISASKAYSLSYDAIKSDTSKPTSNNDIERAYLRSLYEKADYSIDTRRKLKNIIENNVDSLDRFLEVVSLERNNRIFKESEIERRLYRSFPLLKQRLYEILEKENPPFQIGKFVGAIIHLIPNALSGYANDILIKYVNNFRDIQEICIGILLLNIFPSQHSDILAFCRQNEKTSAHKIILQTLTILESFMKTDEEDYNRSVFNYAKLWAMLERSGYFFDNLKAIYNITQGFTDNFQELKLKIENLILGWKSEVSKSISAIMDTPVWQRLSYRRPEIGIIISNLDKSLAEIDLIYKSISSETNLSSHLKDTIKLIIERIYKLKTLLSNHINELFINPVLTDVTNLPSEIYSRDGEKLIVYKNIDQYIERTFCDFDDLNEVCSQITANWIKHKNVSIKGSSVWLNIYKEDEYTVMEFKDDIEGDFDLTSKGGLKMVQDFCKPYGCVLKTDQSIEEGTKSIKLYLRTTIGV